MATRVVGVDIGSFAVRAVELQLGERPTLLRFAQVTLPPGAVRDGEVVDPPAVSSAIRRLWREGGFRSKRVVVGVAGVIVRLAEMPLMSEEEARSALRFEAQELIPIPIDDAILDFQILETLPSDDGGALMRVLLAAAQRDMVRTHLAAIEGGGLTPVTIDAVPFALIRSLAAPESFLPDATSAEAIVCVGGGVTTVVVHEGGVPRFVRVLLVGGDDITEAVARELGVDLDTAEDLKRRADTAADDPAVAQVGRLVATRLVPMVEEIRGSLEYYLAQTDSVPITRVLVTGGASRTTGLLQRLQQQLGERIEVAHPLDSIAIGPIGLSPDELRQIEHLLAVPIGLALAGAPRGRGATERRQITLMPAEVATARELRRQATLAGIAIAAFALLLVLLWMAKGSQVDAANDRAEARERNVETLQRQVNSLADVTGLAGEVAARQQQIQAVLANDVAWTRLLNDIATVLPNDTWLTSFSGTANAAVALSVTGFDHTSTARFILRIGDLKSLTGLWVPSSTKSATAVTFSASTTMTPAAHSDRAQRFVEGQQ